MSKSNVNPFVERIFAKIQCWLPVGWVWRRSALGPLQVFLTILNMVAFGRKGYRAALAEVFAQLQRSFGKHGRIPTSSALTQARAKLNEPMLRELFTRLSSEATNVHSHAQLRYRDYCRIVAIDGTTLALQSTPELKEPFGCPSGDHLAPQAIITLFWDVGGNVPIDWCLGAHNESETAHAREMLSGLSDGDLLLADRLYPSQEFLSECLDAGIDFVCRLKVDGRKCLKEAVDFRESGEVDGVIELRHFPGKRVRLVRAYRAGSEHVVLVTSLMAEDGHRREAIADLYQRRWAVETAYREGKGWLRLADLPGRSPLHVQQELAAMMVFWLLEGELEGQAREHYADEIKAQPGVDANWTPAEGIAEIPVRFNRALAAQMVADIVTEAIVSMEEATSLWKMFVRYLWQNRSRRQPGRSYRRTSQRPHTIRKRDQQSRAKAKGGRAKGDG